MTGIDFSSPLNRRQFAAGMIAVAGGALGPQPMTDSAVSAQNRSAPRLVCNMYYWNMLFRVPFRYIPSRPEFRTDPPPPEPAVVNDGLVWTEEQWHTALSDVQYAGYKRMEFVTPTVAGTPIEEIKALLNRYDLIIDHLWLAGRLYPTAVAEKTIAGTIAVLDNYCVPLNTPEFFFDPFGGDGPQTYEDFKSQNRSLDRIGREVVDRGMKLRVHNHESPMYHNAREWLGVMHNTDRALVSMCLDMDWTWQAGLDPLPLLYEAGDSGRLGALHLRTQHNKIMDQCMEDGGDIDYHTVADYLKEIRFEGTLVEESVWMKETKVTRSARENKKVSRLWCEKVFGVSAMM
jgi:sugar phosphate isomerase/epimerase